MAKEYIEREALLDIVEQQGHVTIDDIIYAPAADVVEVVRCQSCVHAEPFERNCELNSSAYMHCTRGRGEEVRNVWHKYKKYYRDYSVVDRDGYCDEGERRDNDE